ncbi:uncharacterized protein LOC129294493 [Prosopis cineraria]|uniref:uncharacterized protein LOC129294493 n=1 Tax=Prosopis cineraria TaxID=364024 RepID=UPI00240FA18C|nr:uncharacterized protein LOC129294493 [Prosopis cineraria]
MVSPSAVEVAKTVLEVADVAWTAVECSHHLRHHGNSDSSSNENDENLESLRSENRRLRSLLEKNLVLLHKLSQSPSFLNDCPPDLQGRLVDTLRSDEYLTQLKRLQRCCIDGGNEFPFKEATELDYQSVDILISVDSEEPSWWVWVKDEVELSNVEEWSGIDDENYVVIGEEHVVDGVANFMAKCILSNPKARNLSPEELRKTLLKALGGVSKLERVIDIWHAGKMFYALSTWGLALAGLYKSRAVLRLAAKGIHTGGKLALRAL